MSEMNRFGIDPQVWAKFDANLKKKISDIKADPNFEVPVIMVLTGLTEPYDESMGSLSREERKQRAKDLKCTFERDNTELVQVLKQQGAHHIQLHWINRTMSAKLTCPALEIVGRRKEVNQVILVVRHKVIVTTNQS